MDVGDGDPFHDTDVALAHDLQRHGAVTAFHVFPGGHDWNYWDAHTSDYVRFYTAALRDC
jgi:enterochelin esterase-like enzyme